MNKSLLLVLGIILVTGCVLQGADIDTMLKQSSAVQNFLVQHPGATTKTIYLDQEDVMDSIDQIRSDCGQQMDIKAYYKTELTAPDIQLLAYVDPAAQRLECVITKDLRTGQITQQTTTQRTNTTTTQPMTPTYVQKTCTGFQYFTYKDHTLTGNQLQLVLVNGDKPVSIKNVVVSGDASALGSLPDLEVTDDTGKPETTIPPAKEFTIIGLKPTTKNIGESYSYTIKVLYDVKGGLSGNMDTAECTGVVGTAPGQPGTKLIRIDSYDPATGMLKIRNIGTATIVLGEISVYVNGELKTCVSGSVAPSDFFFCYVYCPAGGTIKVTAPGNVDDITCEVTPTTPANASYGIDLVPLEPFQLVISHNYANQPNIIYVQIRNAGSVMLYQDFTVRFYDNGAFIGDVTVTKDLMPSNVEVVQLNYVFTTTGSHTIKVIVDPGNKVTEDNENNNMVEKSFDIIGSGVSAPPGADLTVFTGSPQPWIVHNYANEANQIYVSFRNIGTAVAPKNFVIRFYVDGNLAGEAIYPSDLLPNVGSGVSINYIFTPGNYTVKAVVDATNMVTESNEQNNEGERKFEIITPTQITGPDLVATGVSLQHNFVSQPNIITFGYDSKGTLPVSGGYTIMLYDNGNLIAQINNTPGLSIGYGTGRTFDYTFATTGNHTIRAVLDATNIIAEGNENNNEVMQSFNIIETATQTGADLAPYFIELTHTYAGQQNLVDTRYKNIGNATLTQDHYVRVYDNGQLIKEEFVTKDFMPNDYYACAFSYTFTTLGNHTIKIVADPTNMVQEINENNNVMEKSYNIISSGMPDLELLTTIPQPGIVHNYANQLNKLQAFFRNSGTAVAPSNWVTRFYVDGNFVGEAAYPGILLPNLQTGVDIDYTFASGAHEIKVIIDATNIVTESNETNNMAVRNVALG
jgi:subtilase family serine protease